MKTCRTNWANWKHPKASHWTTQSKLESNCRMSVSESPMTELSHSICSKSCKMGSWRVGMVSNLTRTMCPTWIPKTWNHSRFLSRQSTSRSNRHESGLVDQSMVCLCLLLQTIKTGLRSRVSWWLVSRVWTVMQTSRGTTQTWVRCLKKWLRNWGAMGTYSRNRRDLLCWQPQERGGTGRIIEAFSVLRAASFSYGWMKKTICALYQWKRAETSSPSSSGGAKGLRQLKNCWKNKDQANNSTTTSGTSTHAHRT